MSIGAAFCLRGGGVRASGPDAPIGFLFACIGTELGGALI